MPDISLLIPLANVFSVSTDRLLEVDVEKNARHIAEFSDNALFFKAPYGETTEEKLAIYREEVRRYPDSVELREALLSILTRKLAKEGKSDDFPTMREMASLSEDIIEMSGGKDGLDRYKALLAYLSQQLGNMEQANVIVNEATELQASREVLLPSALKGREQIEARKCLIYKCAAMIVDTVYAMYRENIDDLSEEELEALNQAEKVFASIYGESYANHSENVQTLYNGITGALKRGRSDDATHRLNDIVKRLELQENEPIVSSPLVPDTELQAILLSSLSLFSVKSQAEWVNEKIARDFHEEVGDIRCRLSVLMQSSGGRMREECMAMIEKLWHEKKG